MKVSMDIVNKRREELLKIVQQNKFISVEDLVAKFNVSAVTIRRDLQYWEDRCAIERSYGGAAILQEYFNATEDYERSRYMLAIAKRAALYVEDNDVIFINSSMTAVSIIGFINKKNVTIITNNAKAIYAEQNDNLTIMFTGGEVRFPKHSMTGDITLKTLGSIYANKCFIGCSGLSENGVSTGFIKETYINKLMLDHTKGLKFVLADHAKIGLDYNFQSFGVNDMDYIITDNAVDEEKLKNIKMKTEAQIIKVEPLRKTEMEDRYGK